MAKFLSDVNTKHHSNINGDSLLDDTDDESNASLADTKPKAKFVKRDKETEIEDNVDSGLDNGVQLSDS